MSSLLESNLSEEQLQSVANLIKNVKGFSQPSTFTSTDQEAGGEVSATPAAVYSYTPSELLSKKKKNTRSKKAQECFLVCIYSVHDTFTSYFFL